MQKSSTFIIRRAREDDLDRLTNLLAASFYGDSARWLQPLISWGIYLDLSNRTVDETPGYCCLVAARSKEPENAIATLEMSLRNIPENNSWFYWYEQQYPYLSNLAVHPDWQRRGIASRLIYAAETIAIRQGFEQVYLHVLNDNYPAQRLYDSQGYQFDRDDSGLASRLFGNPRRLLLKKYLKSRSHAVAI